MVAGVLVAASLVCVGSAVLRHRSRVAAVLFAAALAASAADAFGAGQTFHDVAVAFAFAGVVAMVLDPPRPPADDVLAGCRDGRLRRRRAGRHHRRGAARDPRGDRRRGSARTRPLAGHDRARPARSPGWPRWASCRYSRSPACRRALGREPEAGPHSEFSPVVLAAILAYAATALTLLVVGQFVSLPPVAATLATVTVLTGMARAGLTIVERLRATERDAVTDDLTGLGNRRHLLSRLAEALKDKDGEVALLLIDLDGFKELNDTLGHSAGDEVLRQIGPRLQEALRPGDTLARLGGDEFAVVLDPGDEASACATGLRLRAALERSFGVGGIRVHIDASIGIALFPEHGDDALGLLQRADVAMYEAKRTRTGHEVYLPGARPPLAPPARAAGRAARRPGRRRAGPALPAEGRDRDAARCAASRRSCAGRTRAAAC